MKLKDTIVVRAVLFGMALLALCWGYQALLFQHAPAIFNDKLEDLSYGWYVPIISLYIVWRERRKIFQSLGSPAFGGALAAIPFLFAGFLGARGTQIRLEIVGFVGLVLALTWAFWGARTMRRILFPALFLLFCMPLHTYLDVVTIHLRMFAVSCAYGILKAVGVGIVREGTMLMSPTGVFAIDIADPCSGMRSLFAMMAVAAAYAYFTQPTWLRRAVLFASSIPIVIFGNVMRIFTIVLTAATCSAEFATGFYHDYSGYVVFLVSVALLVAVGGLITKLTEGKGRMEPVAPPAVAPVPSPSPRSLVALTLFAGVLVAALFHQAKTVEPVLCDAPDVKLGEIAGFTSEAYEPSEAELSSLPADTQFAKRIYRAANGHWFQVSVVIGGRSKSSIHRPELCLPGQGNQMMNPHTVTVAGRDWHFITLAHRDNPSVSFCYTFFNQAGYRTSSHMARIFRDVWDRSMLGRIDRWIMVTIVSSAADDARVAAFLEKFEEALK